MPREYSERSPATARPVATVASRPMCTLTVALFLALRAPQKPRAVLALENAGLRQQLIEFIRRISGDHPERGEDRIVDELAAKFGVDHAASTIRRSAGAL